MHRYSPLVAPAAAQHCMYTVRWRSRPLMLLLVFVLSATAMLLVSFLRLEHPSSPSWHLLSELSASLFRRHQLPLIPLPDCELDDEAELWMPMSVSSSSSLSKLNWEQRLKVDRNIDQRHRDRRRLYVSSQRGHDENNGSHSSPLRSLEGALKMVTLLRASRPSSSLEAVLSPHIFLAREEYFTVAKIDATHSGHSVEDPLVISEWIEDEAEQSQADERTEAQRPLLSGGHTIPQSCIQPASSLSNAAKLLSPAALPHVQVVDLLSCLSLQLSDLVKPTPFGFSEPVLPSHHILYFQQEPLHLARFPNVGSWLRTGQVLDVGSIPRNGEMSKRPFSFQADETSRTLLNDWPDLDVDSDVFMMGYWRYDWAEQSVQLQYLKNHGNITISSRHPSHYGIRSNARFYMYNLLSQLDAPGEYFIDHRNGLLWMWLPRQDIMEESKRAAEESKHHLRTGVSTTRGSTTQLVLSFSSLPVLHIDGASHVTLHRLAVAYSRSSGVRITNSSHISIDACAIHSLGNTAIICGRGAAVDYRYTAGDRATYRSDAASQVEDEDAIVVGAIGGSVYSKNFLDTFWQRDCGSCHRITRCLIHHTGSGGIIIGGGDRRQLIPSNIIVANNHIHHFSTLHLTYRPALWLDGVGVRVSHNRISHAPHAAILLHGNNHQIAYNDFSLVCLETADVGVVYIGRDFTQRGHIIEHNIFHSISGLSHSFNPISKLHEDVARAHDVNAIYFDDLASGCVVRFNIFHRVHRGVFIGGGRDHIVYGNIFMHCVVPLHMDSRALSGHHSLIADDSTLHQRLLATPVDSQVWIEAYPTLKDSWTLKRGWPIGNEVFNNVLVFCGEVNLEAPAFINISLNHVIASSFTFEPATSASNDTNSSSLISVRVTDTWWNYLPVARLNLTVNGPDVVLASLYSHLPELMTEPESSTTEILFASCLMRCSFSARQLIFHAAIWQERAYPALDVLSQLQLSKIGPCCSHWS